MCLLHGNYRSCGCLRQEIWKELPGQLHMVDGTCVEMLEKRKHRSDNTSGFRGVYQLRNGKYRATIGFQGETILISELLWIIRMRSRPARKRNLPSTKALSAPGTAGTGRQKKIPAGPEIIPWVYEIQRINGEFQVTTNMKEK